MHSAEISTVSRLYYVYIIKGPDLKTISSGDRRTVKREQVRDGPWAPRTVPRPESVPSSRKLVLTPPGIVHPQHLAPQGTGQTRNPSPHLTGGHVGRHWAELPRCPGGTDMSIGESSTLP